jgi:sec-independent protein translocase protein TatA
MVMNILALGMGNLGGPDLFIILLIVLVLFGAKKLPDLARSLGQSMHPASDVGRADPVGDF